MTRITFGGFVSCMLALTSVSPAADLPANKWVVVEDAKDGGTPAGMVYLPQQKGFWHAHQFCHLPAERKVFYFLGGLTFKYDPSARGGGYRPQRVFVFRYVPE